MYSAFSRAHSCFSGILAVVFMLAILLCLPHSALAADLGSEQPHIYFSYENEDGKPAEGSNGKLMAGAYDVSIIVEGLSSASIIQVSAYYSEDVTVDPTPVYLLSDSVPEMTSMGEVLGDGRIVFGFVSDDESTTHLSADGTVIATFRATFAADFTKDQFEADHVIEVATNPNLTFATVNYADGISDSYALVDSFEGYDGMLYKMTCDVFPAFTQTGYDISGKIEIAGDPTGAPTGFGLVGITVDVLNDNGSTIATAVTDSDGLYALSAVPAGEYTMLIHGETTVDRQVTLVVDQTKTVSPVGIVMCDYNRDRNINATDLSVFLTSYSGEYNVYCDFNNDTNVNASDLSAFLSFYGKTISYDNVTL